MSFAIFHRSVVVAVAGGCLAVIIMKSLWTW